jgi:hypothetical protein
MRHFGPPEEKFPKTPLRPVYSSPASPPLRSSPTKPYALAAAVLASIRARDVRRQGLRAEALRQGPPRLGWRRRTLWRAARLREKVRLLAPRLAVSCAA